MPSSPARRPTEPEAGGKPSPASPAGHRRLDQPDRVLSGPGRPDVARRDLGVVRRFHAQREFLIAGFRVSGSEKPPAAFPCRRSQGQPYDESLQACPCGPLAWWAMARPMIMPARCAVTSTDGMTVDYYPFDHAFPGRLADHVINEGGSIGDG